MIRAVAQSAEGQTHSQPDIRWYDEQGGEIGRGRSFDLRNLPRGQTRLGVVVFDRGRGSAYAQWLIRRDEGDQFTLLRGTIGPKKDLERKYRKESGHGS